MAGYNWILTPASIFVGTLLKDFYSKFDGILKDSLSLIKILEKTKFNINSFLFTVDFESLYTTPRNRHNRNDEKIGIPISKRNTKRAFCDRALGNSA